MRLRHVAHKDSEGEAGSRVVKVFRELKTNKNGGIAPPLFYYSCLLQLGQRIAINDAPAADQVPDRLLHRYRHPATVFRARNRLHGKPLV